MRAGSMGGAFVSGKLSKIRESLNGSACGREYAR